MEKKFDKLLNLQGMDKILSFIDFFNKNNNYYTPCELIDLSIKNNFIIDNPFLKIRKGTTINENCSILNNSMVTGDNISIGKNSIVDNARVLGNNISIGKDNKISGDILIDNISISNSNIISNLSGLNNGNIIIGNNNKLSWVNFYNPARQKIIIGDSNWLHNGLNLNCSFDKGGIYIGNNNNLGKDGGGVITTAYQYNKHWWGYVLIGNNVQSTRGAEILGCSMLGWTVPLQEERYIQEIFINGPIEEVVTFFEKKFHEGLHFNDEAHQINLYGVVKIKMCCLSGNVTVRDDTRIQSSYVKGVNINERNKIYFSNINNNSTEQLNVSCQDKAIEFINTSTDIDWKHFPVETKSNGYRESDAIFYSNSGKANLLNMSY